MTDTDAPAGRYRIAEIAQLSGFSPSTLRYYEQVGIFAAPDRTPAGYRLYDDRDVERLRLIASAKDLGCTLDEIVGLVEAWDSNECGPVKHRLRALVHAKVAEVETHLAEQTAFARQLRATADALAARPLDGPCDDSCGCTAAPGVPDSADVADAGSGCGAGCACGSDADATATDGRPAADDARDAVPIACSLSVTEVPARIEQWRHVLDDVTDRLPLPGGARLHFGARTGIGDLAALVGAEQACCPFFSFAITLDQRGLALEVTAPADGQELLGTLFGDGD